MKTYPRIFVPIRAVDGFIVLKYWKVTKDGVINVYWGNGTVSASTHSEKQLENNKEDCREIPIEEMVLMDLL